MIDINPAKIEDADHIKVRQCDVREIWRTSLSKPSSALRRSILASRDAWTATVDGEIIAIFGVADYSVMSKIGSPWLIGSDKLLDHKKEFVKETKIYMKKVEVGYDRLVNYIDDENEVTKVWLKWLGFVLNNPEPYGPTGKPFRKFTKELSSCVFH